MQWPRFTLVALSFQCKLLAFFDSCRAGPVDFFPLLASWPYLYRVRVTIFLEIFALPQNKSLLGLIFLFVDSHLFVDLLLKGGLSGLQLLILSFGILVLCLQQFSRLKVFFSELFVLLLLLSQLSCQFLQDISLVVECFFFFFSNRFQEVL